jgi:hypothetical protein
LAIPENALNLAPVGALKNQGHVAFSLYFLDALELNGIGLLRIAISGERVDFSFELVAHPLDIVGFRA